jgi:DNA-binding NtrC family response regulator
MEKILIIDDEPIIQESLKSLLYAENYEAIAVSKGREGLSVLTSSHFDLVLLDLKLPDMEGLEVLKMIKELDPNLLVIIITGYSSVETAVKAIKSGAYDYIKKPFKADVIKLIVRLALETQQLKRQVGNLQERISNVDSIKVVAESRQMQEVIAQAKEIAKHDNATVLITGDSGTGKQVVAESIRFWSDRKNNPFLEINCAALPATLLESELFGYEKGAFTDAKRTKKGLFEIAENGTVFLDEIGEMPMEIQAKLLSVLEKRRFRRLGGHEDIDVNIRIIAATNIDPLNAVQQKTFREDLYYRLNVFPIHIPPLRERSEDIIALAKMFLHKYAKKFKKKFSDIEQHAETSLKLYAWPGNVRELCNVIERICIMYNDDKLTSAHLPNEILSFKGLSSYIQIPESMYDLDKVVFEVTCELIERALKKCDGNITIASKLLGIPRGTLRYKIKKCGIQI